MSPEFRSRPRTPPAGPAIAIVIGFLTVVAAAVVANTTTSGRWLIVAIVAGVIGVAMFIGGALRRGTIR